MMVADYIAKFLIDKDIKHIFGYQGGAVAKIIDSICNIGGTEYIQNYHEQASAFAASGYAKTNYNIGVAIATSGPGAVNLIGGIADSYCDSVPCMFITGQDYTTNVSKKDGIRLNGFQDIDIVNIVKPITKYTVLIKHEDEIVYELEKCYRIAMSGRFGPVLIDIPLDIQFKEIEIGKQKQFSTISSLQNFELYKINQVIKLIKNSQKPVILCGGGVKSAKAEKELSKLIEKFKIPIVATSNGLGVHTNVLGLSGLHGCTQANLAILYADLLLVLGARLGQRQVGKIKQQYTKAKIIHVDVDQLELGRVFNDSLQIHSDLKIFLEELNKKLIDIDIPNYVMWNEKIKDYITKYSDNIKCNLKSPIDPNICVDRLSNFIKDDAVVTLDVGQNQMWVSQSIKLKPFQKLLSGVGYGSMGCSLPYAIGAYYASNKNQVWSFNGDGGFQMNMQELMLIADKCLDIKIVVFNNSELGLIKETQDRYMNNKHYGTDKNYFKCVNLELLAKTYNIFHIKISRLEDLDNVKHIVNKQGPCIIEILIPENSKLLNKYDDYKNLEINV